MINPTDTLDQKTRFAARFGYGLGPAAGFSARDALAGLIGPDVALSKRTRPEWSTVRRLYQEARRLRREAQENNTEPPRELNRQLGAMSAQSVKVAINRALEGPQFRERWVAFWADHFTVRAPSGLMLASVGSFIDEAIRPHASGTFLEMLRAATKHQAMLLHLNQVQSIGPNSSAGKRRERGLNENHARELIELHTLGVDGNYAQTDVRQLALLMTGLMFHHERHDTFFAPVRAEPGVFRIWDVWLSGTVSPHKVGFSSRHL